MSLVRLTLIIFGTAAYLGLAIFGWGGPVAFFVHPALVALAIVLFALAVAALVADDNLSPGRRENRANRWVIVAFGLIGLFEAYLPARTDRNEFRIRGGDAVRWLGVVLFAAGGALRIWPVLSSAPDSAGWWPSNPGTLWQRAAPIASFATPAIWGCSSTLWDGAWRSDRRSAWC
jgi:hypothetical protein